LPADQVSSPADGQVVRPAGFEPATLCLEVGDHSLNPLMLQQIDLHSPAQSGKTAQLPQPRRNQGWDRQRLEMLLHFASDNHPIVCGREYSPRCLSFSPGPIQTWILTIKRRRA